MHRNYIFVAALGLIMLLAICGCSTRSASNPNDQAGSNPAQAVNHEEAQAAGEQQESPKMETNNKHDNESLEPEITGKLSHDLKDAEGKNMTRVEYRYVSQKGEFLSVVASISDARRIDDITVTEKDSPDAEIKSYKKGNSVPDYQLLREMVYDLRHQKNAGLITWNNAPERSNWKEDKSTTWIVVHFGDIQYIISSRQDLPEERFGAFNRLYTYLTSFVSGFDRKMPGDIGAPAAPIIKTVHGKEVRLVPGTGNSVQAGAEIDYGAKKWWIEEEFNATFKTTPKSLKLCDGQFRNEAVTSAEITIDDNGNFVLHINQNEFIGSLDRTRKYGVWGKAYYSNFKDRVQEEINEHGYFKGGKSFMIDYREGEGYDEKGKPYTVLELRFEGEPYVHGRGAVEPNTIVLERK